MAQRSKYKDLYGRKTIFYVAYEVKGLNKNRLTLLKTCVSSFLCSFRADLWPFLNGCYWNRFAHDRLIHFKPFRFHAVPLFKLSNVLPLNFLYFKTICLIMHDVSNNVTPPNVSKLFTYSSKVHHHNTRFSAAGNFYNKDSRTDHMKNSFSRIGAKIRSY